MTTDYQQYGPEWEKEMAKFPKSKLITMLGKALASPAASGQGMKDSIKLAIIDNLNLYRDSVGCERISAKGFSTIANEAANEIMKIIESPSTPSGEAVRQLINANPYPDRPDLDNGEYSYRKGWVECCEKLKEIISESIPPVQEGEAVEFAEWIITMNYQFKRVENGKGVWKEYYGNTSHTTEHLYKLFKQRK